MQEIIKFLTTNKMKAFYWQTVNGFIAVVAIGFADIEWIYAPLIIAVLNGITKWINTTYLK